MVTAQYIAPEGGMEHNEWLYWAAVSAAGIVVLCLIAWDPVVSGYLRWKTERAFRQRERASRTKGRTW